MTIKEIFGLNNIKLNALFYLSLVFAFSIPLSKFMVSLSGILIIISAVVFPIKNNICVRRKYFRLEYILLVYVVIHLIGLIYSENITRGFQYVFNMWYLLLIPLITRNLNRSESIKLIYAFFVGVLIAVIVSYLIYIFDLTELKYKSSFGPVPFMDYRHYSLILSLILALLFDYILKNQVKIKNRIMAAGLFILLLFNLANSGGRTGMISFIFVSIIILITYAKEYRTKIFIPIFSLLLIAFLFYYQNLSLQKRFDLLANGLEKIVDDNNYNSSLGGRIALAKVGIDIIVENYLLGVGTGDGIDEFRKKVIEDYPDFEFTGKLYQADDFHNQFIQSFVLHGLIGFILLSMVFIYLLKAKLKSPYMNNYNYILFAVFLIASLTELLFNAMILLSTFTVFISVLEINRNYELKKVNNFESNTDYNN